MDGDGHCHCVVTMHTKIYALNLFDCAVTLWLVYMFGTEIEGNVFGLMLLQSPVLTVVFKTVVIGMAVLMLYRYRHRPMVKSMVQAVFGLYTALAAYHIFLICNILKIFAEANLL